MVRKILQSGVTGKCKYITIANNGVAVKTGDGTLARVAVTTKATGTVVLYAAANAANASLTVANIDTNNTETSYELGIEFETGLFLVKTGNAAVSIIYQ